MISTKRMLQALGVLLPLGALGVSGALAAVPGKPAAPTGTADGAQPGVAERLQAIRAAVSQVTADQRAEQTGLQAADPNIQKAWWGNGPGVWANWHPGWGNGGWRNWHNGWGNGGWGNGGWRNWHNGWGNGGWHNFWRNW